MGRDGLSERGQEVCYVRFRFVKGCKMRTPVWHVFVPGMLAIVFGVVAGFLLRWPNSVIVGSVSGFSGLVIAIFAWAGGSTPVEREQQRQCELFQQLVPDVSVNAQGIGQVYVGYLPLGDTMSVQSTDAESWLKLVSNYPSGWPKPRVGLVTVSPGPRFFLTWTGGVVYWQIASIDDGRVRLKDRDGEMIIVCIGDPNTIESSSRNEAILAFTGLFNNAADYALARLSEFAQSILERTKDLPEHGPARSQLLAMLRCAMADGIGAVADIPGGVSELEDKYSDP